MNNSNAIGFLNWLLLLCVHVYVYHLVFQISHTIATTSSETLKKNNGQRVNIKQSTNIVNNLIRQLSKYQIEFVSWRSN